MTKVTIKGKTFSIDGYLKSNLDIAKKSVQKKWDCVFIIDGAEGTAKSTLAQMIGYYLTDGNFNVDSIVFTAEDFMKKVDTAKAGECIVLDEFVLMGMSSDGATTMQKALVKKFTLIRKKSLFICLVIPYLYLLKKYFVISRARFLIHCYTPDFIKRGFFKFYNYDQKNYLFINSCQFWNYPKTCDYSFVSTFSDYTGMFVNQEEYENKKDIATEDIALKEEEKEVKALELKLTPKMMEVIHKTPFTKFYDHSSAEYKAMKDLKRRIKPFLVTYVNDSGTRIVKAELIDHYSKKGESRICAPAR